MFKNMIARFLEGYDWWVDQEIDGMIEENQESDRQHRQRSAANTSILPVPSAATSDVIERAV